MDREKYCMGLYTIASDNALREKVFWHTNGKRLSVENFDGENVDELIKIRQYFPPSKFCAIRYYHIWGRFKRDDGVLLLEMFYC